MESNKRKLGADSSGLVVSKKSRVEPEGQLVTRSDGALVVREDDARTSGLLAPIMHLTGHAAGVSSIEFDPSGQHLASGSMDKQIFIWNVYGECDNTLVLSGHKNAVLEVHWSFDSSNVYSASADKTVGVWDARSGKRVRRLAGHESFVNSCSVARGSSMIASGSDDGTVRLWDPRMSGHVQLFANKYQVTSVALNEAGDRVYAGGLDNDIKVFDLRKNQREMVLEGHTDTITGLSISPDGSYLLSNAMDNTLRCWDIRPFVAGDSRCVKTFHGAQHNFEKQLLRCSWSPDCRRVGAGSSDRLVHIWDTTTCEPLYRLPGHTGSVNQVAFHPEEPIVASCSSDKSIYLGEIAPVS